MVKLKFHGSAKWAGRMLVVGALALGPVVMLSSTASSSICKVIDQSSPLCTITGTATVTGGTLSIGASSTIKWSNTLNGYDINQDGRLTLTAIDATGSGSGWTVTASVTPFTDSTGTTTCSLKHPCSFKPTTISFNGSSSSPGANEEPKETCTATSTCSLATNSVTYPVDVTATCGTSGTACAPTVVASASTTSGMGAIVFAVTSWMRFPADAHAGTYTGTITLTISSGP